jgi:ribonuclease BN (tRNA processing enzyme)
MQVTRRTALAASIMTVGALAGVAQTRFALAAGAARTRLVLLGTKGGPRVETGRSNPANLLLVGDRPYVIDCGYGVARQLAAAEIPLPSLRKIFITHLHSDHVLEFGTLVDAAWSAGLRTQVDAYGPAGLKALADAFWESNRFDVETRMADEGKPDPRKLLVVNDITDPGPVMADDRVRVTAFRTPHPPILDGNYAYKFETLDGTIVFSSDTAYNPALADFAKGADVLVHEALFRPGVEALASSIPNAGTLKDHLLASHTTTEDVGRIAAAAGVKTLVLSHLVPGSDAITDAQWSEGVRKSYKGDLIVGRDLMEIALPR